VGFGFRCQSCGEIHEGMPGCGAAAPLSCYAIMETERASRRKLSSDNCITDDKSFFVRGCLEIPVHGADGPLICWFKRICKQLGEMETCRLGAPSSASAPNRRGMR
jgi:hypothetical protein